jgi:hypothetical protein
MHQGFREAIWLCGLASQLYLGFALIEEIDIHTDPVFTMSVCGSLMTDSCVRYTIVAGMFIILMYFIFMLAVTMALQASFYWAWSIGWKNWWIGRAAYWMWGPVEEADIDLEKGGERHPILPPPVESSEPVISQEPPLITALAAPINLSTRAIRAPPSIKTPSEG